MSIGFHSLASALSPVFLYLAYRRPLLNRMQQSQDQLDTIPGIVVMSIGTQVSGTAAQSRNTTMIISELGHGNLFEPFNCLLHGVSAPRSESLRGLT